MSVSKISFDRVKQLSARDIHYQLKTDEFSKFYQHAPDLNGLKAAVIERKNYEVDRKLLVAELQHQYQGIECTELQKQHINSLLDERTFTIITAHQPSLLTGPLYYIYKIFSTINLAEKMSLEMPDHRFVPVFINGGEDHDFAEIDHFQLFGKTIQWEHRAGGPVGRLDMSGFDHVVSEFRSILGESDSANDIVTVMDTYLTQSQTYNDFVFRLVNHYFKKYGLVVLSMDSPRLKKTFAPMMVKEVFERPSESLISETQMAIAKMGYHAQAFPREINLFYLGDGYRERIIEEDGSYKVLNTDLRFTAEEIKNDVYENAQNYSPNVVMRPLYQEAILPNIAYVGGGGELAYWLERKSQFAAFNVFFPTLIRRNSVLLMTHGMDQHLSKLGFEAGDFFSNEDELITRYLESNASFDIHLSDELTKITEQFEKIVEKASQADATLHGFVESEKVKVIKQVEQIESRIKRSLKKNEETSINQIRNLKSKVTPNGGLQERTENFFQYYLKYGDDLMNVLKENLDPLDPNFLILHL